MGAATLELTKQARRPLPRVLLGAALATGLLVLGVAGVIAFGASDLDALRALGLLLAPDGSAQAELVRSVRLPRAAAGVLAGFALGSSGAILQAVVRNPLAESSTLGVTGGAYLAITIAAVFGLSFGTLSAVPIAFAGGLAAAALVVAVGGGLRADPVRIVLAGVAVSLACSAGVYTLQILNQQETAGVLLFGSGAVDQPGWAPVRTLAPLIPLLLAAALLVARDLDALALGDEAAAGLGVNPSRARLRLGVLAVAMAAVATALVGWIAFIGLAAAHIVRRLGILSHRALIPLAGLTGAALLPLADSAALLIGGDAIPAGVVCTIFGAPLLIAVARRVPVRSAAVLDRAAARPAPKFRPLNGALVAVVGLLTALLLAVATGEVTLSPSQVWNGLMGNGADALIVQELRLPRALVAAAAGGALALSGALLQGVARNPLAGPEMTGVSGGAALGAITALLAGAPSSLVVVAAFAGGIAAVSIVVALAPRGLEPERLILIGVAMASGTLALVHALLLHAGPGAVRGLTFLSGTTYSTGWPELVTLAPLLALGALAAWLAGRRLDTLAAGDEVAVGLGLRPARARAALIAVATLVAAGAVAAVGALGFVGLMAPHAARLLVGARHRAMLPVTIIIGAALVLLADVIGRAILTDARELQAGAVTALLGAPAMLVLLRRVR